MKGRLSYSKCMADGGKVFAKPKSRLPQQPKPNRPRGDTIQSPKPKSTADALRNQRTRQEKLLGFKNGGMVKNRGR